jgi:uncharacterized protein YcbK (DUF882 family)
VPSRFFVSGDGFLEIENAHTREKVSVRYRETTGAYSPDALAKLDGLFRSRGDDESTRLALRLVELIDYLEDQERPRTLLLISGYRSEGYNSALIARGGQAARASLHTQGLAADLRFAGADHRAVWNRLRRLECCGAGFYEKSGFLHVDTGRPRFWEQTTSRVGENLSKGNARVIARTDFDRYDDLVGLEATLHAVTLRPLRVASRARLVRDGGKDDLARLVLEWPGAAAPDPDGCFTLTGNPGDGRDLVRVASVEPSPAATRPGASGARDERLRARVVLETCPPRLEATPRSVETNLLEASAAALQARHRPGDGG